MSKKRILLIGKRDTRNPFPKEQFDVTRVVSPEAALTGQGFDLVVADEKHFFNRAFPENVMPWVKQGGSVVFGSIAVEQQGAINLLSEALGISRDLCDALRRENEDLKSRLECVR